MILNTISYQPVFIPADGAHLQEDGTIGRFKVGIANKELVFKTYSLPAARYLYFQYLTAIPRARRHGLKGDSSVKPDEQSVPWATPGK